MITNRSGVLTASRYEIFEHRSSGRIIKCAINRDDNSNDHDSTTSTAEVLLDGIR